MNIKEIIDAWIIAGNPTKIQKELAEKRMEMCSGCDERKEIIKSVKISHICGKCGCPIQKKVFTKSYNACPLHKWGEVDKDYFSEQKNNKSLI